MTLNVDAIRGMMTAISETIAAHEADLNELDAALGDGDHGTGISAGFAAALEGIGAAESPSAALKAAAMQLMNRMGGASGAVFGTLFLKAGTSLPPEPEISASQFASMWQAGRDGVAQRGKAKPGDKTMLDALSPAVDALSEALAAGQSLDTALAQAAEAAAAGAAATADMQAKHGRAKYIGERSIGHVDAGARSIALMFAAIQAYFET